ncbi:MAG: hypothetical protein UT34_C0001G0532 [candidate division WS6 bacterium GW2011_GWF2_39_15]|uniref:Uncharacterized protein n=1 Tax=candidate division WS6 bacterium GW2011_GWF2_39_15 TaxID=1619100 RepID=A0A0G0N0W9_9BACT|nr:MAG: hypothetical protein UT34_C0001G0532 [candidate division WS6 bacterium GW2011_GWF2_39_15]
MKTEKKKSGFSTELSDIAKVLSGELQLRKREEEVEKLTQKAVKKQKDLRRKKIIEGEARVETEDKLKKVVQKIKLYEWEAPIRFNQPFNPKMFLVLTGVMLLFIMYLAVLGHYGLMASIIALLFFFYVAGTTPPITVKHEINTKGIDSLGKLYEWFLLDTFWFTKREDQYLLVVGTKLRLPNKLMMIVGEKEVKPIFLLLQDKLLYKDIRRWSKLDQMNFGEYIPIEKI